MKIQLFYSLSAIITYKSRISISRLSYSVPFLFDHFLPLACFFPWGKDLVFWTRTLRCRVIANSPNLWPTLSSVILQGMWVFPLQIWNVQPTNSGRIVDLRDQIFLFISCSLLFFAFNKKASTKQSFHIVLCTSGAEFPVKKKKRLSFSNKGYFFRPWLAMEAQFMSKTI